MPTRSDGFANLRTDEFATLPDFASIMKAGTFANPVDLPTHLKFARLASLCFLALFMLFALIIMTVTALALGSFVGELLPSSALGANLVLALALGLVSMYAFMGVKQRLRSIIVTSALILTGIIVAQIVIPATWVAVQPNADEMDMPVGGVLFRVESLLAMSWSTASNETRSRIQQSLGCCGAFNWPQNCYVYDEHTVGTPANHYNMAPSLTTVCNLANASQATPPPQTSLAPPTPTLSKTPRECCFNAGFAIVTINETACFGNEIIALCCQPPCVSSCGKHEFGCIDLMLESMSRYRATLIIIASLFAAIEILGVVFLFWFHVSSVRFENTRNGDVLARQEDSGKRSEFGRSNRHEMERLDGEEED